MRKTATAVVVRPMVRSEVRQVAALDGTCFEEPVTEKDIHEWVKNRNRLVVVADLKGTVAGHLVYERARDEVRLLRVGVLPRLRRLRIGMQMVEKVLARYATDEYPEVEQISAVVHERNVQAQVFLRSMGFWCSDVLKGHYPDDDADAYLMTFLYGR